MTKGLDGRVVCDKHQWPTKDCVLCMSAVYEKEQVADLMKARVAALEARIAELEFKVKLGDDFKERAHYVAKATQAAWEETVAELEAENARLREAVDLVILKHRVRKERGTLVYFELPSEELEALAALLGGGEK